MTEDPAPPTDLVALTVAVVAAYVARHRVEAAALPDLITSVHAVFAGFGRTAAAPVEAAAIPAVTARKSLANPEFIVSMIDGKPYRTLKRHLTAHGLTPDAYRARYRLAADYPMVAPAFSEQRRAVAKALGLGRTPRVAAPPTPGVPPKTKTRRGRPPKVTTG